MKKYTITQERLVQLLQAECRCNVLDEPEDGEHYQANLEFYRKQFLDERDLLRSTSYDGTVVLQPTQGTLKDLLVTDFDKRVSDIEVGYNTEGSIYDAVLKMHGQDCYSLFGRSNDNLEDLEYLSCMLSNGLYDDAYLGVVKSQHGFWNIDYIADDFSKFLSEEDVRELIKEQGVQSTFYKENKETIERRGVDSKEYFALGRRMELLLRSFMRVEDSSSEYEKERKSREELMKRIERLRNENSNG